MTDTSIFEQRKRNLAMLSPADDGLHKAGSSHWFEHETIWYWFCIPERNLGGWFYHYVRPNIGVAGGGMMLFDHTSWSHLETPYYQSYSNMPMPDVSQPGTIRFVNNFSVEVIEPFRKHRLKYHDRNIVKADLIWEAVTEPWINVRGEPAVPHHLDQFGRFHGELQLHGETLRVDCYAARDRTWNHARPEPWKDGAGGGPWVTAAVNADMSFHCTGPGGFLVLDGVLRPQVEGSYHRERDHEHGFAKRIFAEGVDDQGRRFKAVGDVVSRLAILIPGVHGVCWKSLVRFDFNGVECWGEDQDAWPINMWSAFKRAQKGLKDIRRPELEKTLIKWEFPDAV